MTLLRGWGPNMYEPGEYAMRTVALSMAAVGALLTVGNSASADIITARFDEVSPRRTVSISGNAGASFMNTSAGSFNWTRTGGDYDGAGADGAFVTYCIELAQHISYGSSYSYETRPADLSPIPGGGMGSTRANLLAELFGRYYNADFVANDEAAAFQVAVWELSHDDGANLLSGTIRVVNNGAWFATAQGWLDSLDGTGPRLNLLAMTHATAQDQIFVVPNGSTAALMGLAAAFGYSGRRRRPGYGALRRSASATARQN